MLQGCQWDSSKTLCACKQMLDNYTLNLLDLVINLFITRVNTITRGYLIHLNF